MIRAAIAAYQIHGDAARKAYAIYSGHCEGSPPPRVPGCDTVIRLALRIHMGRSIEEAAAGEYVYRWHLAVKAPDQCSATGRRSYDPRDSSPWACVSIFGTPHTIGL